MKKLLIRACVVIVLLCMVYGIRSGLMVNSAAWPTEFKVSEDGRALTLNAGVMSSVGHIRACKDQVVDGKHYLKFYAAFGGINGSIGAKNAFTIPLGENDSEIYCLSMDGKKYRLCYRKNADSGIWEDVRAEEDVYSDGPKK